MDDILALMRSGANDVLPPQVRRALRKLGTDIAAARKRRHLKVSMMAERVGVSKQTYQRVEKGDPRPSIAVYAMSLFVLGFASELGNLADVRKDDAGLLLEAERLPKRVRDRSKEDPAL
jgi:DNA-binding XRE family transcriptional regulator